MKTLILFLSLLPTVCSQASDWRLSLGSFFNTNRVEKGALIWSSPSYLLGPSLSYKGLKLQGPRLKYSFFPRRAPFTLDATISYFNDSKPWIPLTCEKESFRNQRPSTWVAKIRPAYNFGYKNYFSLYTSIEQDMKVYKKPLIEFGLQVPLYKYTKVQVETSLLPKEAAAYFYGPGAKSGLTQTKTKLTHFMRKIWSGAMMINTLSFSTINHTQNVEADYIRGRRDNWTYQFMLIWNFSL